jgi:hypothetical protein
MWPEELLYLMASRKLREKEGNRPGTKYLKGPSPSDILPPALSHFLKFPKPPQMVPPARDQVFNP